MKKRKIFIFIIGLIYIAILSIDSLGNVMAAKYSPGLKFMGVMLCFIMTLNIGSRGYNIFDTILLQTAMFFTVMADFLLVILNEKVSGVFVFCIVQSIYIIRHNSKYRKMITVSIFAALFICFIFAFSSSSKLYIIAALYSILLFASVLSGIKAAKYGFYSQKTSRQISIGLILFMLCDINVAVFNLSESLAPISGMLIWFFYLPSQALLALSGYKTLK